MSLDASGWFQLGTYLASGTAMIIAATWHLSNQIGKIRVELAERVTKAEGRLDALERDMSQRLLDDRAFQAEMRNGHLETIRSLSELKLQIAVIAKRSGGSSMGRSQG
jgi:hypothetical protein